MTAAMMLIAACGGSGVGTDSNGVTTTGAGPDVANGEAAADTATGSDATAATVTIGDDTYEFSGVSMSCNTGNVIIRMADDDSSLVVIQSSPDLVEVTLPGGAEWIATASETRGAGAEDSSVDSVNWEGDVLTPTVEGTATFYNSSEGLVEGSFHATCAE